MKKFSVYAVMAMGVLTVSSAAFAGTTAFSSRGLVNTEVSDTVVPKDTVLPEKTETEQTETQTEAFYSLADTVLPTDTVVPQQEETIPQQKEETTPQQEETIPQQKEETTPQQEETIPQQKEETTPQQEETTTSESTFALSNDTVVPVDTLMPSKKDEPQTDEPKQDEPQQNEPQQEETVPVQ